MRTFLSTCLWILAVAQMVSIATPETERQVATGWRLAILQIARVLTLVIWVLSALSIQGVL